MTATKTSPATTVAAPTDLTKAVVNVAGLRAALKQGWKTISGSLPTHMSEERFFNLVLGQAVKDSGVFKCTGISILNALQNAASLGLEVNASTGEAYLIPYRDNQSGTTIATLVPGYKGLAKLVLQSPEVGAVSARLVYEAEEKAGRFKVLYGTDDRIHHEPDFNCERTPDKVVAAYAIAKMNGGAVQFEVMTITQLNALRDRSLQKTQGKGPWKTDTEEMYRKTPFRRLCKYLPLTPQLAEAIELADRAETGEINTPKGRSAAAESLNKATATISLTDECVPNGSAKLSQDAVPCHIRDGRLFHGPDCPHFDDADGNP